MTGDFLGIPNTLTRTVVSACGASSEIEPRVLAPGPTVPAQRRTEHRSDGYWRVRIEIACVGAACPELHRRWAAMRAIAPQPVASSAESAPMQETTPWSGPILRGTANGALQRYPEFVVCPRSTVIPVERIEVASIRCTTLSSVSPVPCQGVGAIAQSTGSRR